MATQQPDLTEDTGSAISAITKLVIFLTGPPGTGKTTTARELSVLLGGAPVIEVDDVKVQRHGSTERCIPIEDFPEAGRLAATCLQDRSVVIVVEAFADDRHIEMVRMSLPAVDRELVVLLECDIIVAVARKQGTLSRATIRGQFERFTGEPYPGRRRIPTTEIEPAAVARMIAAWILSDTSSGQISDAWR